MINSIDLREWGLTIDNSPTPFVIIGPQGRHRQVIIRSADAPMDLIVMDDPMHRADSNRPFWETLVSRSVPRSFAVKGSGKGEDRYDNREVFFTFAWRGLASTRDTESIEIYFSNVIADLQVAIQSGSLAEVEWTLAPLLAKCRNANESFSSKLFKKRFAIISLISSYGIMIAVLILYRYLNSFH